VAAALSLNSFITCAKRLCLCMCAHVLRKCDARKRTDSEQFFCRLRAKQKLKFRLKGGWGLHWYGGEDHLPAHDPPNIHGGFADFDNTVPCIAIAACLLLHCTD
jgi:hypothetical protein